MDPVTECELTKDIKQKIFDLLRSVIPETSMTDSSWLHSKHSCNGGESPNIEQYLVHDYLFSPVMEMHQYPNSHLIYGKRWLSIVEGFVKVKSRQSQDLKQLHNIISNVETFLDQNVDNDDDDDTFSVDSNLSVTSGKKKSRVYQKERATALSAVNRVYKSYSTRFLSWWSSVEMKLNNPIAMQQALSNSLRAVFGFKTSFRPGFSLATNFRFDTKQPVLSREILNTLFEIMNKGKRSIVVDTELEKICNDHKLYVEKCYNETEQIDLITLVNDPSTSGISKVVTLKQPQINDRTGKRQANIVDQESTNMKRIHTEHLTQCIFQTKKFKKDRSLALNSLVFGSASMVNESHCSSPLPSVVSEDIEEKTVSFDDGNRESNSGDNAIVPVNCYQKTTTVILEDLFDEEVTDSFLDAQKAFMMDQSQVAIDMLRHENFYFVNQLNVLANELGL